MIKLKAAYLHQPVTWPGHPSEKTLTTTRIPGLEIFKEPTGIVLKHKQEFLWVPNANIICALVDTDSALKWMASHNKEEAV